MANKGEYIGATKQSALLLPCEEAPVPGRPLVVTERGRISSQQGLSGQGIQSGAIEAGHLSLGLRDILFGGARDGEADFDGTSTVLGIAPVASVYTLTKELAVSRMHVRTGATVRDSGYRVFARELHMWGTAIIHTDGPNGGDGSGQTAGEKGSGVGSGNMLGGSSAGGNGGAGGATPPGAGSTGAAGANLGTYARGGDGGQGGAGSASGGAGGAAAAAGFVSTVADVTIFSLENITRLVRSSNGSFLPINGGAGGGGGGGGGASAGVVGRGGGAGGSGGGVVLVSADEIILHDWTGRISANGGTGGVGTDGVAGDGGGAGGGGGGLCVVIVRKITGGVLSSSPTVRGIGGATFGDSNFSTNYTNVTGANILANGGNGGAAVGGAGGGYAGGGGTAVLYHVGQPFVPIAEMAIGKPTPPPFYGRKPWHCRFMAPTGS